MPYSQIKQPGLCSVCETPVFEIVQKYPNDHPLAGKVLKVGKALDNAWLADLVLSDGTRMSVTVCDECRDLPPEKMRTVWDKVKSTWDYQRQNEFRTLIGTKPLDSESEKKYLAWFSKKVKEIPVGVTSIRRWENA